MDTTEFTICLSDTTKATLSNIQIDHCAFEAEGVVTANVTMHGVSKICSGLIYDEEITTDDTREEFDELFDLVGLCDGQDQRQERLKLEVLEGFEEIIRPLVSPGSLCPELVYEKLEQEGFHLFGKDPARDFRWHVGKYISQNTARTYRHYESLLQLVNSFNWNPASFRKKLN